MITHKQFSNSSGYTLIELVIVIGLTVLLLVTATSLFFTTFIGGGKTASTEYVKQEGQNSLNQITYLIRNARKLIPNIQGYTCGTSAGNPAMTSIGLLNQDGGTTYLYIDTNSKLASSSAVPPAGVSVPLMPTDLTFASGGSLAFSCTPYAYGTAGWDGSPPQVTVDFTLQKGNLSVNKARDIVTIPFESNITLRNY